MWYKISPVGSLDCSQSMRVTDGQTDGQNYDSQDRASIAASRGKTLTDGAKNRTVRSSLWFIMCGKLAENVVNSIDNDKIPVFHRAKNN